jgi:hypothetical protein
LPRGRRIFQLQRHLPGFFQLGQNAIVARILYLLNDFISQIAGIFRLNDLKRFALL